MFKFELIFRTNVEEYFGMFILLKRGRVVPHQSHVTWSVLVCCTPIIRGNQWQCPQSHMLQASIQLQTQELSAVRYIVPGVMRRIKVNNTYKLTQRHSRPTSCNNSSTHKLKCDMAKTNCGMWPLWRGLTIATGRQRLLRNADLFFCQVFKPYLFSGNGEIPKEMIQCPKSIPKNTL